MAKMTIVGVKRLSGVGKQSNRSYNFTRASVLNPVRIGGPVAEAVGFEVQEIDCSVSLLADLGGATFPLVCECEVGLNESGKGAFIESATPVTTKLQGAA